MSAKVVSSILGAEVFDGMRRGGDESGDDGDDD